MYGGIVAPVHNFWSFLINFWGRTRSSEAGMGKGRKGPCLAWQWAQKDGCAKRTVAHARPKPTSIICLCTGASLYAPYSLLLISNKFWMGGGGGRWGRSEGAEFNGENKRGGAGRLSYFMHLLPHPPQHGPRDLPRGLFTSLVYLWLTYVYAYVGMMVCTCKVLGLSRVGSCT